MIRLDRVIISPLCGRNRLVRDFVPEIGRERSEHYLNETARDENRRPCRSREDGSSLRVAPRYIAATAAGAANFFVPMQRVPRCLSRFRASFIYRRVYIRCVLPRGL